MKLHTFDDSVNEVFAGFWKPIVMPDGEWDLEQVKRELYDFKQLIGRVEEVYCHITDGAISKSTTSAEAVIAEADDVICERIEEALEHEGWNRLSDEALSNFLDRVSDHGHSEEEIEADIAKAVADVRAASSGGEISS